MLTATQVRATTPREKPYKLFDERGLFPKFGQTAPAGGASDTAIRVGRNSCLSELTLIRR